MSLEADNLAAEALSLETNPTLQLALDSLRNGALEALADIDPTDPTKIMAIQADIRSIDNLRGMIGNMVRSGRAQKHPTVA